MEVLALTTWDIMVVCWEAFEWFWAELVWKSTVIVADWSWDTHRNFQKYVKQLMSWDRWMVRNYDTYIWTRPFYRNHVDETITFWWVVGIAAAIPVAILGSPILIPLALLVGAGTGIYYLIALIPWYDIGGGSSWTPRVTIYDYQLKIKYEATEYAITPTNSWVIHDDYYTPAKQLAGAELAEAERRADADLAERIRRWADFKGNNADVGEEGEAAAAAAEEAASDAAALLLKERQERKAREMAEAMI